MRGLFRACWLLSSGRAASWRPRAPPRSSASSRRWRSPGPSRRSTSASQTGIFAKHGLEVEASAAAGDAKLQQALTADSADIGIGSGPGMAFMAKGVPAKAVAVMYGVPKNMAVMVGYNSPIKTVDDLKGKKLGCTTVGSLTHWIGDRINQRQGLGRRPASPWCRSAACRRRAPR